VPVRDGETIAPGEFEKLSRREQDKVKKDIEELTARLQHVMRTAPKLGREIRKKIHKLEREVASLAVAGLIDDLMQKYQELPDVVDHLQRMQEDIVENVSLFLPQPQGQGLLAQLGGSAASRELAVTRRYAINVLVDRSECEGAPVVFEDQPSFTELIGKIEHEAEFGTLVTNLGLIQAGALHRANGGYLVIDVDKVFSYPASWEGLKRAMKSGEIRVRSLGDEFGLVSTVSLEPEPIPLNLKVILIGERKYYYLLARLDPEFPDLFKVAADFEDDIKRSDENIDLLTRLLVTTVRKDNLKHLSRDGVARIIDESSRQTTDLLREAHFWASQNNKELIDADDVEQAVESRIRRTSRLRERLLEETVRETLVIETAGASIGQVNGLAVLQLGGYAFGRAQRISATVTLGSGKLIDIEREVKLGGPLHSKGVLILSGFLSSYYVSDRPLSLSASLVFEQSYGGVDGDSASAAEFCALGSALAEIPIKQSLAVTGSIDQHGRVQAIGGVNQKIEGFFEICKARGLSGDQGVLIPLANVKHLMLHREVVAAVRAGEFNVYAVDHVDQCLELLTGLAAGKRYKNGEFAKGSVSQKIRKRLLDFAVKRQSFGGSRRSSGK
jgi:lon-related putative ATP-dependent protease